MAARTSPPQSRAETLRFTKESLLFKEGTGPSAPPEPPFSIGFKDGSEETFSSIILATGSAPAGYILAESLGHGMVKPVPSLFTLNCKHDIKEDGLLYSLSGISVPSARVSLSKKLFQEGPLLITVSAVN